MKRQQFASLSLVRLCYGKNSTQSASWLDRGFSLIEVLTAITLFIVGFLVLLSISRNYLQTLRRSEDRLLAVALAQEGLELVMAKRNLNVAEDKPWLDGLDGFPNKFCIDMSLMPVSPDPQKGCQLFIENGFYKHSGTEATKFSRQLELIKITEITGEAAAKVVAEVFWPEGKVQLQMVLAPWHPKL
jgi:hypothetical protein